MKRRSKKIDFDAGRIAEILLQSVGSPDLHAVRVLTGARASSPHVLQVTSALARAPITSKRSRPAFFSDILPSEFALMNPNRAPDLSPDLAESSLAHTIPLLVELPPATLRAYLSTIDAALATGRRLIRGWGARPLHASSPARFALPRIRLRLPSFSYARAALAFFLVAFLATAPLQAGRLYESAKSVQSEVMNLGREAFGHLERAEAAAASGNVTDVGTELAAGAHKFGEARGELERVSRILRSINARGRSAGALLEAGETLSAAAANFAATLASLKNEKNLLYKTAALRNAVETLLPAVDASARLLEGVSPEVVPAPYHDSFVSFRDKLDAVRENLAQALPVAEVAMQFLGSAAPMRLLIVFQNNAEIRPTGGFIGSFAEVTVAHGEVERMVVPPGGSYDLQGGLRVNLIPPDPIATMIPSWQFHDANWFPDFPTSARKLQWFYEKSGGPTTDGVIAITSSFLPELLAFLGPVTLPDGRTITSANVLDTINQSIDRAKERGSREPKQVISLLAPALLERLLAVKEDQFLAIPELIGDAFKEKKIMVAPTDRALALTVHELGLDGALPAPEGDFLAVVHANIGGGKSDAVTATNIKHEAVINEDGTVVDTVKIWRTHNGPKGDHRLGRTNVDYLRVYVPAGSELLAATGDFHRPGAPELPDALLPDPDLARLEHEVGIEPASNTRVTEEFGKTVFGNWLAVPPGETKTISFTYRLHARVSLPPRNRSFLRRVRSALAGERLGRYALTVWQQPGADRTTFETTLIPPEGYAPAWETPKEERAALTTDQFFAALISSH